TRPPPFGTYPSGVPASPGARQADTQLQPQNAASTATLLIRPHRARVPRTHERVDPDDDRSAPHDDRDHRRDPSRSCPTSATRDQSHNKYNTSHKTYQKSPRGASHESDTERNSSTTP